MAYTSRNNDIDNRYEFRSETPTVSKLVKPSNDFHTAERQAVDRSFTSNRRQDDDMQRTRDSAYGSINRSRDDQYSIQQPAGGNNLQEIDRRGGEYSRRIPTANVVVDPTRRPGNGNSRTCVMEINIAVNMGGNRAPQASITSSNVSAKQPNIRSTATIDNVRYIDLNFQSPNNTAQLATDGIIHSSPSQRSTGYPYEHTNK
ncbi:hypothetical protein I4U23_025404 [Adineta vaga]|nr:hypothetical protein I4U23_025404 [Adineta vaga]